MYFGGFLLRKPGTWPTRMALRSMATAVTAIAAGWAVQAKALPVLTGEVNALGTRGAVDLSSLAAVGPWLPFAGVPGLVLGIAAMLMKPLRPVLAILAVLASLAAVVLVVGSLVASLAPTYNMPRDLDLGSDMGPRRFASRLNEACRPDPTPWRRGIS